MKIIARSSTIAVCLVLLMANAYSQDLDLIVTAKGDSIACHIDSISDTHIYFEMKTQNKWAQTHIVLTDVSDYKRNAIDDKLFIYKSGTSIIESPKPPLATSMRDIQKNSVYVGILSINYARMIPGERVGVTVAGGFSFVTALDGDEIGYMLESTLLTGGGTKHFFEPGILLYFDPDIFWPNVRTGYRYQGPEGFLLRAGFLWGYVDGFSFLPALSIGYSF